MTRIYFVRHAQPEHEWKEDRTRPLTEEGKKDATELSVDPFYSQENMDRLRNSVAQMEATGGTVHEVDFDD